MIKVMCVCMFVYNVSLIPRLSCMGTHEPGNEVDMWYA